MSEGFTIDTVNDYQVVASKVITNNLAASLFFGSRYNINPAERVVFRFIESYNSVRILAESWIVTNPGSAFEKITEFNDKSLKNFLERIKMQTPNNSNKIDNSVPNTKPSGPPVFGVKFSKFDNTGPIKIIEITAGSDAEKKGLKVDDIIVDINNSTFARDLGQ